jgi:putative phosphoribosyl transferase
VPDPCALVAETIPVTIQAGLISLEGELCLPSAAIGLVILAHGNGSSLHSPRNHSVARALNRAGLATLLLDLLTPEEERVHGDRVNLDLLSQRLDATLAWIDGHAQLQRLQVGLQGASAGTAAAIRVAARRPGGIGAVVSRGGRPDLAGRRALGHLDTPTLLIVGGEDTEVLELNEAARRAMRRPAALAVIPGASHLFEEAGALQRVSELACDWFSKWLGAVPSARRLD